jgi:hypothetical protein
MWVNNYNNSSITLFNFSVHLSQLLSGEVLRVELEIHIFSCFAILLRPLDVTPQYVNGKVIFGEIFISLHQNISTDSSPFTEIETKHMK